MSDKIHINELLSYVSYYIHNSSLNNIKKIISDFYTHDEIISSKKILWNLCEPDLGPYIERKSTDKRTSLEANLNDVFEAFSKLDSIDKMPIFAARELNRLPNSRQPEELNIVSMINRIAKLEEKLVVTNELVLSHEEIIGHLKSLNIDSHIVNMESLINDNKQNSNDIKEIKKMVQINKESQDESVSETCNEVGDNLKTIYVNLDDGVVPSDSIPDETKKQSDLIDKEISDEDFERFLDSFKEGDMNSLSLGRFRTSLETGDDDNIKSIMFDTNRNTYRDVTKKNNYKLPNNKSQEKSIMSPVIVEKTFKNDYKNDVFTDEDGFVMVKSKHRTPVHSSEAIIGAAPTLCTVWINRIVQGNVATIKRFLNNKGIRVQKIVQTSHVDARYMSFKIIILRSDSSVVLNKKFWPEGVNCKIWKDRTNSNIKSRSYSNSLIRGRF